MFWSISIFEILSSSLSHIRTLKHLNTHTYIYRQALSNGHIQQRERERERERERRRGSEFGHVERERRRGGEEERGGGRPREYLVEWQLILHEYLSNEKI